MNCETASGRLPELLSGALDREYELETLTHLAQCSECRRELAFWARMRQASLDDTAEVPADAIENVRDSLFGPRAAMVLDSIRKTGRALGLAGSACRLAFTAAGLR